MKKTFQGSCHCSAVRFEADIDLGASTYRCNCSICTRHRFWLATVAPQDFRMLAGQPELTSYRFNTGKNQHLFCRHCGVRPFGMGSMPDGQAFYAVNIGCLENATPEEMAAAPITYVDGKHDKWSEAPAITSYL